MNAMRSNLVTSVSFYSDFLNVHKCLAKINKYSKQSVFGVESVMFYRTPGYIYIYKLTLPVHKLIPNNIRLSQ